MASATEMKSCIQCPKGLGQVMCDGCQRFFCLKHLHEHQLKQILLLDGNDRQHPLLTRVDRWEARSMKRIKQVADEVRQQIKELLDRSKTRIGDTLHRIANEIRENQRTETFNEVNLEKWMDQLRQLRNQFEKPSMMNIQHDQDEASSTHLRLIQLQIIKRKRDIRISNKAKWSTNGQTMAGGHEGGDAWNQLNHPYGLDVDDDGTMFIADVKNHRIMRWKPKAMEGEMIVGRRGQGNQTDQLDHPLAVLMDQINNVLIVSERGNRRVMRWSLDNDKAKVNVGQVIISNILSFGLALDNQGSLYISDFGRHEVRRYGPQDGREGVIVAGGFSQGARLNQLNYPRDIYVDDDRSVYISDTENHRVVKWARHAREARMVAGGQGQGNSLEQLSWPSGIFVDRMGSIYVVDQGNNRVMRWSKDAKQGEIIASGSDHGSKINQLSQPASISFDNQGNLYVVDLNNHRIQRFDLQSISG